MRNTDPKPTTYAEWEDLEEERDALRADRDALRAELDLVRGAIRADDERLYAAWVRIHGAPDDCANIGCDAPEWMADEILRLRAELERTKVAMERVRRSRLRRLDRLADQRCDELLDLDAQDTQGDGFYWRWFGRMVAFRDACRAALERKADA